jgi:hypothetical protein
MVQCVVNVHGGAEFCVRYGRNEAMDVVTSGSVGGGGVRFQHV